ncbi:MAG: phosphohydrolase, partial [Armatimonadaceae bacterium]
HADWTDPNLLSWLDKDLASAKQARWRFVVLHHPPFQSSKEHFNNQWMRVLAPRFEKHRVNVVWSGHVHNYQRSHPLRFQPSGPKDKDGKVDGKISLDTKFDGIKNTRPGGILYVVTGAGGASLYEKYESADGKPMAFTAKMVNNTHSLTVVDIDDRKLSIRQVAADGKEIDKITVTQ